MTHTSMVNIVITNMIDIQVTKDCGEENDNKNEEDDNKNEELFGADEVVYIGEYEIENFFDKGQVRDSGEENLLG